MIGICTECGGRFKNECACDPCAHGKARTEDCVFCERGTLDEVAIEPDFDSELEEEYINEPTRD